MYIEIRKVRNKGTVYGGHKSVEPIITTDWRGETVYSYKLSDECFERPNITYKFIAKRSYRSDGKVKSRSAYIASYTWSDFVDGYADGYIREERLKEIQNKLSVSNHEFNGLLTLFDNELDEINKQIHEEFLKTMEYNISSKVNQQIDEYRERVKSFEEKYGKDTYCRVKDFYGSTMNIELMEKLEGEYTARCRYEEESRKRRQEQWDNFYKQFNNGGSQLFECKIAYTDSEKVLLKKFYKTLSQKFHPDSQGGSNDAMQLVNKLKQQWGV